MSEVLDELIKAVENRQRAMTCLSSVAIQHLSGVKQKALTGGNLRYTFPCINI